MKAHVGFMGMGIMGTAMAANLIKAGLPVTVYNRAPGKTEALAKQGATVAASPLELAKTCEVIIAMVTGPEALESLIWGKDGAAAALDRSKTLINMSSVTPRYTRDLAKRLASTGAVFIDAPVSGTKKPAEDGTLIILAGGPQDKVDALTPLLLAMGKKVVYCGEAGQGAMMKMFINLMLGVMMTGFAEALNFGEMGGLNREAMLDTLFSGPLNCPLFQMKAPMLAAGEYPTAFPLKHMSKDAKFALDTAYEVGAPAALGHAVSHLFSIGKGRGWGDLDVAAIAKVMEYLSATRDS